MYTRGENAAPAVDELMVRSWTNAEKSLRELVRTTYRDRDEEYITDLFHGQLEAELNQVSQDGLVQSAFLHDLKQAFWTISDLALSSVSHGLVATVSFHAKEAETKTGGDLGIVFVRPDLNWTGYVFEREQHKRGLLCQAKIFRRNSRWGRIGVKQAQALRGKLGYCSLLLYRYSDQSGERRELAPFAWQLGRGATIRQINRWLASDNFPDLRNSGQILLELATEQIGTDNSDLIVRDITPPQRPSMVIEVWWKKPDDPGDRIYVQQDSPQLHQLQRLRS